MSTTETNEGTLEALQSQLLNSSHDELNHEKGIYQTAWARSALKAPDGTKVVVAGRVVNFRHLGKIAFGKLVDQTAKIQFALNKKETPEQYKNWVKSIKMGSIISVEGEMWTSSTGEKTILVNSNLVVLRNSIHPFPNKVDGLVDPEVRLRKRYLDVVMNPEVKEVFKTRSKIISTLRRVLESQNFMEIETPILQTQACGAQARPFKTHHHAYDTNLYLRIAPETYLKRAVAASFDRVYEIGKNFRNEGADSSHLQEFTSIEWYAAYWDYKNNLKFFQHMLPVLFEAAGVFPNENGRMVLSFQDVELDFTNPPVRSYSAVFEQYTGRSPWSYSTAKEVDEVFKNRVRPNLIQPIYLIDYPAHMSPLAHRSTGGNTVEQWQFIVNGQELVKCYTELTDPVLQRKLLEEQMAERAAGDEEAMMLEESYLECMEYGIPPCSGLGLGIDRFVALLTNRTSLRDVVLFPTVL